jgi:glucokinase
MAMKRHLLGVDIGGTKIAILAREVGSNKRVYADKLKTPSEEGVGATLHLLDEQIDNLPGGRATLKALGVAVPGHVDHTGRVIWAGNLKGWVNVPLRQLLQERYGVPVYVERDANCGALGEKWCGAARKLNDFVFLSLGTGVGAGLFLDGRIYRGAHFAAGEAGDMSFPSDRPEEAAPTVSDVVGKRAIKRKAKRATGEKMSAAEALAKAPKEPRLARATREAVEYLSSSVVAISSLLDPEAIIFGGGTSNAGEALLNPVRKRVESHLIARARLLLAELGADSMVYGALWGAEKVAAAGRQRRRRAPARDGARRAVAFFDSLAVKG